MAIAKVAEYAHLSGAELEALALDLEMIRLDIEDSREKLLLYMKTGLLGPASGNSTLQLSEGKPKPEPKE